MFPLLSIDYVTSALMSTNGNLERALPLLLQENQIAVERQIMTMARAQTRASPVASSPTRVASDDLLATPKKPENVRKTLQSTAKRQDADDEDGAMHASCNEATATTTTITTTTNDGAGKHASVRARFLGDRCCSFAL